MKCLESCVSFRFSFMVIFIDDFDIMVKAEDRACQQERLGHIIEKSRRHVVDLNHLICTLTEGRFFCYILPMIVVTKEPSLCYKVVHLDKPVP